jgi:hypothetical protein
MFGADYSHFVMFQERSHNKIAGDVDFKLNGKLKAYRLLHKMN